MILTGECFCGQKLEFEAEDLPQLNCPKCGRPLAAQFARVPRNPLPKPDLSPPPPAFPAVLPDPPKANQTEYEKTLASVRDGSCYKTLRGLIEGVIGLGFIVCGFAIVSGIYLVVTNPSSSAVSGAGLLAAISAVAIIILVAIRQAFLLGIDAVDVLIIQLTDRKAEERHAAHEKIARLNNALDESKQSSGK